MLVALGQGPALLLYEAKEAKEALSAKQQQIERLKQHAFLEAGLREKWVHKCSQKRI